MRPGIGQFLLTITFVVLLSTAFVQVCGMEPHQMAAGLAFACGMLWMLGLTFCISHAYMNLDSWPVLIQNIIHECVCWFEGFFPLLPEYTEAQAVNDKRDWTTPCVYYRFDFKPYDLTNRITALFERSGPVISYYKRREQHLSVIHTTAKSRRIAIHRYHEGTNW